MSVAVHSVSVLRVGAAKSETRQDAAAVEEPLEIRLDGTPFVVTMRTPGADRELAAGFLLAEGILNGPDDLGTIQHCTDQGILVSNVVNVTCTGGATARARAALERRRAVVATSACGVCGRQSIEDLMTGAKVSASWRVSRSVIASLPDRLRGAQSAFEATGGLHAAGLFDTGGVLVAVAEDVGRHNAVDKVIGAELLAERFPLDQRILLVSGRTSFEIVQKAIAAGIPMVAAISAPTSLAIDLATEAGVTLLGFLRGGSFNVYASPDRIEL